MRDFKVSYNDGFDIDIVEGYPVYVDYENQTQDQRAAIGATIVKGTIPGNLDYGVDWAKLWDKEESVIDISNDVNQVVQDVAGGEGSAGSQYIPMFYPQESGEVQIQVIKGTMQ